MEEVPREPHLELQNIFPNFTIMLTVSTQKIISSLFSTRLKLNNEILDTVDNTKLLGTIVPNDLTQDLITNNIVKKAFAKMELLKKTTKIQQPPEDLKHVYTLYIRSLLEQSCTVWHSSLTIQNSNDLERVQKVAWNIILKDKFINYKNALNKLELKSL